MSVLAAPAARRGGPLRHRDFRLFWIGQTTSRFGSAITSVALPLVALTRLGASTFEIALLPAAVWLPWLLIGLPAGVWVDRLPQRALLLGCDAVSLLVFVAVPVAAGTGVLTIGHLLLAAVLAGTASVFFETAYQVYLPSLLSGDELTAGNARLQGSESAAQIAGPGAGGLLTQAFGAVTGLLADAVSFAVSMGCLLAMRHREPPRAPRPRRPLRRDLAEGLRFLARDPYLRVLTVFGAASNLALIGYQSILVVFLVRENGVAPGAAGGIVAAMSAGGLLGAALATRVTRRFGTARGMLVCQLGAAPFALLIPLAGPGAGLVPVVVGGIGVGVGVVAGNVIKGTFRQTYTPHHLLGRVTTGMHLLNYGSIPLGALLGGLLGTAIGLRPTMWVMAAGLVAASLVLLVGPIRRRRDLPAAPAGDRTDEPVGGPG